MEGALRDRFTWSGKRHKLHQFMELYGHRLPQIVIVRGYFRDECVHQFAAEEMYWVCEVATQPRVVLTSEAGENYSFPLDHDSSFKVQRHDGTKTSVLPLAEATRRCVHKKDRLLLVHAAADREQAHFAKAGPLRNAIKYEQQYLLGHPLIVDEVMPERRVLPLNAPIQVDVATGLTGKTKEQFVKFTSILETMVTKFKKTDPVLETGILVLEEGPVNQYIFAKPLDFNKKPPSLPNRPPVSPTGASDRQHSTLPSDLQDCSIQEVTFILKNLRLDSLAADFEARCVDGALLMALDEDILLDEFKCSRFDARKLDKFIRGWRPKT